MGKRVMFLGVIFLLLAGVSLGTGLPMMYRITPEDQANVILSNLIFESLEKTKDGSGIIRGSECTTPNHYLEGIRKNHPSASLVSVDELPAYVRGLHREKIGDLPVNRKLSRILFSKSQCKLDLEGWSRDIRPSEFIWVDPNTGEIILAGDCLNVVSQISSVGVIPELPLKKSKAPEFSLCNQEGEPKLPLKIVTTHDEVFINFGGDMKPFMFWLEDSKGRQVLSNKKFYVGDKYHQWYEPRIDCNREVYIKWWDHSSSGRYWSSDEIDRTKNKVVISVPTSGDIESVSVICRFSPSWGSYMKGKLSNVKYKEGYITGEVTGSKKKFLGGKEEVPLSRVVYLFNDEGILIDRIMTNKEGTFVFLNPVKKGKEYKVLSLYPLEKKDEKGNWYPVLVEEGDGVEDGVIIITP